MSRQVPDVGIGFSFGDDHERIIMPFGNNAGDDIRAGGKDNVVRLNDLKAGAFNAFVENSLHDHGPGSGKDQVVGHPQGRFFPLPGIEVLSNWIVLREVVFASCQVTSSTNSA